MKFSIVILCLLSIVMLSACDPATPEAVGPKRVSPNRMPDLNLPMPPTKPLEELGWTRFDGGKKEVMDEYKGKVVLLDFWATYCPPCIKAIPHLRELKKRHGDDLVVIGLHVGGPDDRPQVPAFQERLSIDYPIATPEDELTYLLLGNDSRIPQTVIFDREGKKVKKFVSYDDEISKQIDKVVKETIEG